MGERREHLQPLGQSAVLRRAERMVESSRMGEEDAARLRAAAKSGGLDEAVGEVRRKHAIARAERTPDGG